MNTIGIVVTAYRLHQALVSQFLIANAIRGVQIVLVHDWYDDYSTPQSVDKIIGPPPDPYFNIGAASNAGIRRAAALGCDVIIKTDIDAILSDAVIEMARGLSQGYGGCYRYWQVDSPIRLEDPQIDPKTMGTIMLTATDWNRVGGYDERLTAYGVDDFLIFRQAKKFVDIKVLCEPKVYHVRHNTKHGRETINPPNHKQNRKFLSKRR